MGNVLINLLREKNEIEKRPRPSNDSQRLVENLFYEVAALLSQTMLQRRSWLEIFFVFGFSSHFTFPMGSSWDDIYGPASFKKIQYDIWPLPRQQSKNVIKSHVDLQQQTLLCQNDHDICLVHPPCWRLNSKSCFNRELLQYIQYFAWTYLSS